MQIILRSLFQRKPKHEKTNDHFKLRFCSFSLCSKARIFKMPKFAIEDLKKSKSDIDEKAPAEILYRSVHYRMDNSSGDLLKEIAYRIKVYDKDKVEDWLNLEISLYDDK